MSDVLRRARLVRREFFDPTNPEHVESFKTFLRTNSWGDVQFWAEAPYTESPATVMTKFARHALNVQAETDVERAERMTARNISRADDVPVIDAAANLARANELFSNQLKQLKAA